MDMSARAAWLAVFFLQTNKETFSETRYLDYKTSLAANISKPHFSIPIVGWKNNRANLTLPDASVLRAFSTFEIENELSCDDSEGRMDQSCPAWDHNIALGVACAPTHEEAYLQLQAWQGRGVVPGVCWTIGRF